MSLPDYSSFCCHQDGKKRAFLPPHLMKLFTGHDKLFVFIHILSSAQMQLTGCRQLSDGNGTNTVYDNYLLICKVHSVWISTATKTQMHGKLIIIIWIRTSPYHHQSLNGLARRVRLPLVSISFNKWMFKNKGFLFSYPQPDSRSSFKNIY